MNEQEYGGAAALRRRVAHWVDTVAFDPPGMSPSSILLVRRLSDPLPRRLAADSAAACASPQWERAVRARLGDCHRRALRPALGPVPSSAESILFVDQAELLACLARDLIDGNAAALWWWRAILRALPAGSVEALVAAWQRDARYVPAALRLLSLRREAVAVVQALSPAQAWSVLEQVAREFEIRLPAGDGIIHRPPVEIPADVTTSSKHEEKQVHGPPESTREPVSWLPPPWRGFLAEDMASVSLGRERAALLGVSALLESVPAFVRTSAFARAFSNWYHQPEQRPAQPLPVRSRPASIDIAPDTPSPSQTNPAASSQTANDELTEPLTQRAPLEDDTSLAAFHQPAQLRPPFEATASEHPAPDEIEPPSSPQLAQSAEALPAIPAENEMPACDTPGIAILRESVSTPTAGVKESMTDEPPPATSAIDTQSPHTAAGPVAMLEEEPIATSLGGVLFLINLLRALRMPASLESEFGVGSINAWELLELLARALLGPRSSALAADPIWKVLAALAGRETGMPFAAGFQPQACYCLPSSWIPSEEECSGSALAVRLRASRVQLWHPRGFMIADCQCDPQSSPRTIEQEVRAAAGDWQGAQWIRFDRGKKFTARGLAGCAPLGVALPPDLRRFLAFLLPCLRWRLLLALGLRDGRALAQTLFSVRGELYVTRTHVDLMMNLNEARASVRMAGLDADPGWAPDLGRVVKFNFVQGSIS